MRWMAIQEQKIPCRDIAAAFHEPAKMKIKEDASTGQIIIREFFKSGQNQTLWDIHNLIQQDILDLRISGIPSGVTVNQLQNSC